MGYTYGNNFSLTNIGINEDKGRVSLMNFEGCSSYIDVNTGIVYPKLTGLFFQGEVRFASKS
jgi:hypothetical protein